MGLLGAIEERQKTGQGQHVDISEVDVMADLLNEDNSKKLKPMGNASPVAAPHNVYRCQGDRWCAIAVFTEEEWGGLKKALGNPPWADDEKFSTLSGRLENQAELDKILNDWTQRHTAKAVMSLLQKKGVAAGIVQDAANLTKDVQLKARRFFKGAAKTPFIDATPIKMSGVGVAYKREAPTPGRDNDYVYGELLGIGKKEIKELKEKSVI
jgi:crotonobetainyl-CoA:carnitine CoA-transferase CaiB-like acyl-CoA transferase